MKHLLLLLFLIFQTCLLSQNKQKDDSYIIFSRVYEEPDDGPCNLFINDETSGFGISSKKIKCTASLIDDFKKLKEKSFKWKKSNNTCLIGYSSAPVIENQLIIKSNTYLDTIYFNINEYENTIINYNGESYIDSKNDIYKTLSKNNEIKTFFDAPIKQYYYETIFSRLDNDIDSLDVNDFKISDAIIFGKNVNEIDSIVRFYKLTNFEIRNNSKGKISVINKYEGFTDNNNSNNYYFFNDENIIRNIRIVEKRDYYKTYKSDRYKDEGYFEILGLKIGDNHQKIKNIFPNSSKYIENISEYFKNKNGIYSIDIPFEENKGFISYNFKDGKIVAIEIQFYYD